jgi:hypothetical protein
MVYSLTFTDLKAVLQRGAAKKGQPAVNTTTTTTECGRETGDYKTTVINSDTVFTKL